MKKTSLRSAFALAALSCAAGAAHSANVSINNVTALWFDGNPAANVTYHDNNTVSPYARWGTGGPGGQQSGYDFDVANLPINFVVPPSPSPNQVLGTFKHQNFPINAGSSIDSIKLRITADVFVDAAQVGNDLQFEYGFSHWETDNGQKPTCANGEAWGTGVNSNGCADRVIANWLASSDTFIVGLDEYTLNVIGFSLDSAGANPFNSFWTAEGQENLAYLVGNVTLRSDLPPEQIPEPATLALVGAALAGIAASRRRRHGRA
jgi:hypothetical protein